MLVGSISFSDLFPPPSVSVGFRYLYDYGFRYDDTLASGHLIHSLYFVYFRNSGKSSIIAVVYIYILYVIVTSINQSTTKSIFGHGTPAILYELKKKIYIYISVISNHAISCPVFVPLKSLTSYHPRMLHDFRNGVPIIDITIEHFPNQIDALFGKWQEGNAQRVV